MTAAGPFHSSWFRPWTIWENPLTRFPGDIFRSIPQGKIDSIGKLFFVEPEQRNFVEKAVIFTVNNVYSNPLTRLSYAMAERILNSTAPLKSLKSIDALSKTTLVAISIAGIWLAPKHPFIAHLELGGKGLGAFVFAKHLPELAKKCYLNCYDKKGDLILGKVCKTIGITLFQSAHFDQLHESMKKFGFFHILSGVASIGYIGTLCLKPDLARFKNPAVVIASLFAVSSVAEWGVEKLAKTRMNMAIKALVAAEVDISPNVSKKELAEITEKHLKAIPEEELAEKIKGHLPSWWVTAKNFSYTNEEEVDQLSNLLNNGTKGWVVGGQAGWFPKPEPYFEGAGNLLGLTNVYKEAGYIQAEELTAVVDGVQASELWLGEKTFPTSQGRPGVKFEKATKEDLKNHRFFRI